MRGRDIWGREFYYAREVELVPAGLWVRRAAWKPALSYGTSNKKVNTLVHSRQIFVFQYLGTQPNLFTKFSFIQANFTYKRRNRGTLGFSSALKRK